MTFARRYLARDPAILVVADPDETERLTAVLEPSLSSFRIETAGSIDAALDAIVEATGCVVTAADLPDGSGIDLATQLADRERAPPVVLVPETVDETVALATTAGVDAIVPAGELDRLPEAVTDEAAAYLDRLSHELQLEALETLFDAIEDVFQIKDAEGRYLRLLSNREWPAESEALGKTDLDLHDGQFDQNRRYYEADRTVLETGEPILGEITEYGDGLFWLETTKVPLRDDDGRIRGIVGHVRDVSERMGHRRELERKNERLDRFASYLTHDLQNPLSIATGYLELAREGDEEAIDTVEDAIGRMQQLIDDIEILARGDEHVLQAGTGGTLTASRQSVEPIVHNVWSVLATDAATLEIDLLPRTGVYADEREFRAMIENLLKNAIQHGGDDVTVRIGAVDDGIYVEDDGPGVPAEDREEIFEQGFSTAQGGTGTGLAIVDEVASAHEWDVRVTDGTSGGARFVIGNCLSVGDDDRIPIPGDAVELTESTDVGEPGEPGRSSYDAETDTWTVEGAGEDVWGQENDFHFVHATLEGDARIEAQITDVTDVYEYSKAGVMIRDGLDEDSAHGYVGRSRGTIEVLWCPSATDPTTSQHVEDAEGEYDWLRLDRDGERLTASVSTDGEEWLRLDERRVAYDDPVHAGLVVCSAVHRERSRATFENVSVRRLDWE